jgi:hypothetical protein
MRVMSSPAALIPQPERDKKRRPAKLDSLLWFCAIRVQKMSRLRFASHVTVDPFLQLTLWRGATFLAAVYSNESSPQRRVKGTKNGCTSDTQRA